ncbi:hypothetical protein [Aeromonas media]
MISFPRCSIATTAGWLIPRTEANSTWDTSNSSRSACKRTSSSSSLAISWIRC